MSRATFNGFFDDDNVINVARTRDIPVSSSLPLYSSPTGRRYPHPEPPAAQLYILVAKCSEVYRPWGEG